MVVVGALLPLLASTPSQAASTSACPEDRVPSGSFSDVDPSSVHAESIDCVAWWGVTTGRSDGTFGGNGDVTRGQLATFLTRAIDHTGWSSSGVPDAFDDDADSVHEPALNELAALGIMQGVAPRVSAHGTAVTRAQSASLVARTLAWLDDEPLPPGPDRFSDDEGSPHEDATNSLAALGIIEGTTATTFSPDRTLTRAQMASVLVRSLSYMVDAGHITVPDSGRPEPPDMPPPSSGVSSAAAGDSLQVAWASESGDPHRWKVLAFADGRYVGQRTFAGSARSGRIDHLPPGSTITTWVVPIDADGAWSTGMVSEPVTLPRDPACPAGPGTCVHIDATTTTGAANGAGLGLLQRAATDETDQSRIDALQLRHWRLSPLHEESFRLARATGASLTVTLSDAWFEYTNSGDGRMLAPWADWGAYESFITEVARWHLGHGLVPDRWEVQNEPSPNSFIFGDPVTPELLVEQHVRAARAVRSIIPDAEIVGPAVSPPLFGHDVADIQAFTALAAPTDIDLEAITWHEIMGYCQSCDGGPTAVRQHIDDARAAMRAAGLGGLPVDITEFATTWEQLQPGAIVGYFTALAEGGVRYGGTSCWFRPDETGTPVSSCAAEPGTLNGLLLPDGTTPTDAWWTYRAYAELADGAAQLATTTVDSPAVSAVASVTGDDEVHVLIGRHFGCTSADAPCPTGTPTAPAEPVDVHFTAPSAGLWTVVVSRIDSVSGAAGAPVQVTRTSVLAGLDTVDLGSFTLDDGEVLQVVATLGT